MADTQSTRRPNAVEGDSLSIDTEELAAARSPVERVLLPAVRAVSPETLIIADGFSCREQIAQTTNRRAVHIADVAAHALQLQESTL